MIKKEFDKILYILIPKAKEKLNSELNCNCNGGLYSLYIKTEDRKIKISKPLDCRHNDRISISYHYLSKRGTTEEGYCREVSCYNKESIDETVDEIVNEVRQILKQDRQEIWEVYNKGAYTDEYEL